MRSVGTTDRSAHGSWWFVRPANGLWPDCAPPFTASRAAVGLHRRTVDQDLRRRTASRGQAVEYIRPHTLSRPADETVVQRLARAVDIRRVRPTATRLQDMNEKCPLRADCVDKVGVFQFLEIMLQQAGVRGIIVPMCGAIGNQSCVF